MSDKRESNAPGVLERYRSWKAGLEPKKRLRWRIIRIAAALCVGIVLLWTAYGLLVNRPDIPALNNGVDVSASANQAEASGRRSGVYTLLVVGKDTGGGGNTDTMILATYDTKGKSLDALSLPRDTMTNVSWNNKKLNTVYNYYKGKDKQTQVEKGMTALRTHVGKLTGILPDFYVMVEWDAVGELVDAIGGVTFNVPYDMHYDDPYQDLHIHQEKGERKLTGEDAMQVIRWRKNNGKYGNFQIGDSGRMKVQQDFLVAVAKECLQLKHLMNTSEFARIFTENVYTNLSAGNLAWLAQQAIGMDAEQDVHFHTMPYTPYTRNTAYVLPVVDELLAILNDGMNPYKKDITADDLEVLQLKGDGSLYLTSGTLEDKDLAKPRKPKPAAKPVEPEQPPVVQLPEEVQPEQVPEQEQQVPSAQQPEQSMDLPVEETPVPQSPVEQPPAQEPVEEVPNQSDTQTTTDTTDQTGQDVNILPADPVPVQ